MSRNKGVRRRSDRKTKVRPEEKRTSDGKTAQSEQRVYHYLDEQSAKVLYVILRMQYMFDGHTEDHLPGANLKRIESWTGIPNTVVSRKIIPLLEQAGYIVKAGIHEAEAIAATGSRDMYELHVRNCITCRDSAVLLLSLLSFYKERSEEDGEGKIDLSSFVSYVQGRLQYFTNEDLWGNNEHPGKFADLANLTEHIERVSVRYIRPRLKLYLEQRYLELVAKEVKLEALKHYSWQ